jgi:ribosome biogenesis GTPase
VRRAADEGALDPGRLSGYRKLQREAAHVARRTDALARITEQKRWKRIHREMRRRYRERKR